MSRDAAARGLRLSRRPCAASVRSAAARRDPSLRVRDRVVPRAAGREADRRRVQLGDLGRARAVAGTAHRAGRRRDRSRGGGGGTRDAQPSRRTARDAGDGRRRPLRAARARARRRRRLHSGRVSSARAADRDRRAVRGDARRGARVRGAAQALRRRHGHPRLHALPAREADLPAGLRARRVARLLRGGDCARGRGDAGTEGDRKRGAARGHVPVPDDRRPGRVPRAGPPLPAAADRRGRARRAGEAEGGGVNGGRNDGRRHDELRPLDVELDYLEQPHGAVLWSQGKTKVLCTASVQDGVPRWLYRSGRGWLTAEYSLLPASTGDRTEREASRGKQGGRTVEIQRLIGRAIRSVVDFQALGERTLWLDCDVLQADGGTRCAAICGAYVAANLALDRFGLARAFTGSVAAVSVGVVGGTPLLDLDYSEDSNA